MSVLSAVLSFFLILFGLIELCRLKYYLSYVDSPHAKSRWNVTNLKQKIQVQAV